MNPKDVNAAPSSDADVNTPFADVPAPPSGATDVPPPSSGDTGDEPTSLLAAVKKVVELEDDEPVPQTDPAAEGPEATPGQNGQDPKSDTEPTTEGTDAKPADEPTDEEMARYTKGAQDRIRQLVSRAKAAEATVKEYQTDAEQFRQFQSYLTTSQLSAEDTNLLLGLGAALRKGDFATFLDGVLPYVQLAQEATGQRLPADLQEKVDSGYVTEDMARDYARTRYTAQQLQAQAQEMQTRQAEQARQANAHSVASAVTQWETSVRTTDPDYSHKEDAVRRYAQALVAERGAPQSPEQAVEYARLAYEEVNRLLKPLKPAVQPTRPTPTGAQVATSATPAPRTLMEAAMAGLHRARSV